MTSSIRQTARDMGVHPATVSRALRAGRDLSAIRPGKPRQGRGDPQRAADIAALAAKGLGGGAIAEELGIKRRMTVYEIAARHGIDVRKGRRDDFRAVRDQVADMRPLEAVEHLLYLVEELLGSDDDIAVTQERLGVGRAPAKAYLALSRAAPRALTATQLAAAIAVVRDDPPDPKHVAVVICKLRKALPARERVVNIHGTGYRLERTSP